MRIRTNSNTLHITRMLDTPEHKKVWREYGPRALELATIAKRARPRDPEALCAYADAFFFSTSTRGVLKAAVSGSGLQFKANAKELIAKCPTHDGGIGHCYLGAFYLMAPWPLHNAQFAEQHLSAAHRLVPSRRNSYYMGVLCFRCGRLREAQDYFAAAVTAPCNSPSEEDFGDFMAREASDAIRECERRMARTE